jgi:hypothetical protein
MAAGRSNNRLSMAREPTLRRKTFSNWASSVTSDNMNTYPDAHAACCAPAINVAYPGLLMSWTARQRAPTWD